MGRRKIEIKAIKDDRNRSVTFLKRKGGLFKKAHELSVLCSVDVAVFIFGSNKKLYEYSSCDMHQLINRYTYHGAPNEHKGPADFNGGADDDDEEDENATPPQADGMEPHMLPPQYAGQPPFPQIRHNTPSASPPISNGMFGQHQGHGASRVHTPQPQMTSRPSSRNDIRRMGPGQGPNMAPQVSAPGPTQPSPAFFLAYQNSHSLAPPNSTPGAPTTHTQYVCPYPPAPHMVSYMEEQRRSSVPPNFPPHGAQVPPQQPPRHSASPPQPHQHLPPQSASQMSPRPPPTHLHPVPSPRLSQQQPPHASPQPQHHEVPRVQVVQDYQPPMPLEPKTEIKLEPSGERVRPPLLDTGVKKHKGSIFTPIDEHRSILSQHLAAFHQEPRSDAPASRSHSTDAGRPRDDPSPPSQRNGPPGLLPRTASISSIPEATYTPLSRSDSFMSNGPVTARPRLKVQIPDEPSPAGTGSANANSANAGSATASSSSSRNAATDTASQPSRHSQTHSSGVVLPPPSPSASALLSAGASGPPNPFARPPPQHQSNMNIDTPVSALPSRFLNNEFLPSPSSFYPEWNFRGVENNTLPSPLNFATPVAGHGPSFLRDDMGMNKRKSPEVTSNGPSHEGVEGGNEPKRIKVDS